MPATTKSVLALDFGASRIGLALASMEARLASPLVTLDNDATFFEKLDQIMKNESVGALVVGLPRGLAGQQTGQTTSVESFVTNLKEQVSLPIYLQDEAVTSKQAEAELEKRGKPYSKADIDALAATYILEDWLSNQEGTND